MYQSRRVALLLIKTSGKKGTFVPASNRESILSFFMIISVNNSSRPNHRQSKSSLNKVPAGAGESTRADSGRYEFEMNLFLHIWNTDNFI